jgi:hypothetical protein
LLCVSIHGTLVDEQHDNNTDTNITEQHHDDINTTVTETLKNKFYSIISEIDSKANDVTNQELETAIGQLESINNSLVDRKQIANILPPLQKQKPKGRPSSTKRNASQFEVVDATIKKKAKLLTKM